ncbi:hypothetical protein IE53DRAFT_366874 [Violaceomyces palustris]|uniref:Uncharacterized protein n=1 Tax=Violaceomyces palustris TaxID=1673888 RepID=A0ACD0P479_9BASI|nr:hypothetical protein IE53DRAFT_366874 [Violaceomyces palustris]
MSFNDLERGSGSNDTPLPLYRTDSPANQQPISPDFEKLSKRIGIQIFKINSNVTGIAKLISLPQKSNAQGKDWTKQIGKEEEIE